MDKIPSKQIVIDCELDIILVQLEVLPRILVCCVYNPPSSSDDHFNRLLDLIHSLPVQFVNALVEDMNVKSELMEKQNKDVRKKRREEAALLGSQWLCGIRGCAFNAQSKDGLVNHQRQKHGPQASILLTCQFCGSQFRPQGLRNHEKACCRV